MIVICGDGKIPSKKNRMIIHGNRMIKDKGVRNFENHLSHLATLEMKGRPPYSGPCRLVLSVIEGDRRRRDLQNYFGSICDALNNIVYDDDSQIVELIAEKCYNKGVYEFTITVQELDE